MTCACVCVWAAQQTFAYEWGLTIANRQIITAYTHAQKHTHTYMQLFTAMFVRILASTFARLAGCLQNLCRLIVVGCGELLFLPL